VGESTHVGNEFNGVGEEKVRYYCSQSGFVRLKIREHVFFLLCGKKKEDQEERGLGGKISLQVHPEGSERKRRVLWGRKGKQSLGTATRKTSCTVSGIVSEAAE